jgi:hypothetical protein
MKLSNLFWFVQVLFAPIFGLFAAGASAMGGGDGGNLAATLGVGDGGEGGEGDGSEGAGEGEGGGAGAGDGTDGAGAGEGGEGDGAAAADGRKMPAALRSHIAELKAAGKADLAKELNTQYWSLRKLNNDVQQHFPGGLKEAIELKQQIEEVGGVERFQELESEAQEYRQVDELLEAGDPKVVSSMFEQFPEGMAAIMPAALEHWSEADSENYDRHMAGIAHATIQSSGMSSDMQLAYALLEQYDLDKNPSLKRVAQLLAKGHNWLTNLGKYAQEKPAANGRGGRERGDDKLTAREQKVQQQERQQTIRTISSNYQSFTTPKFESVLTAELKGKAIPATGKQAVFQQAIVNIMKVLGAGGNSAKGIKSEFERKYDAYLDNGDMDGALKLLKSRSEPLIQKAVQDAYKYLYGDATLGSKKKPGAAGAGVDGKDKGGAGGGNTDGGFELIGYDPKPESIDRVKTTRAMIFKNQAILKNGKKVTWKKGAPAEK